MIKNSVNVSRFDGLPPQNDEPRDIPSGPLYPTFEIKSLAESINVRPWSNGAVKDAQKWCLSNEDIADLIKLAVTKGIYGGSEWCKAQPAGPWAACDAYTVSRPDWIEATHKYTLTDYYLKFAISKTGTLLLSASNHPQGT
ncbi:MAG: hypothetical protein WA012_05550 [Rhodoferax sp.]|jgi:hypothetical protein|uniref:hypothetical protein n=1 Tax=Rhodoferax sp. TaxID=50421 RepID=UPI003BB60E28